MRALHSFSVRPADQKFRYQLFADSQINKLKLKQSGREISNRFAMTTHDREPKMHMLIACLASVILCCCLLVNGQDFGFPEETGLGKEKQNADVSDGQSRANTGSINLKEIQIGSDLDLRIRRRIHYSYNYRLTQNVFLIASGAGPKGHVNINVIITGSMGLEPRNPWIKENIVRVKNHMQIVIISRGKHLPLTEPQATLHSQSMRRQRVSISGRPKRWLGVRLQTG